MDRRLIHRNSRVFYFRDNGTTGHGLVLSARDDGESVLYTVLDTETKQKDEYYASDLGCDQPTMYDYVRCGTMWGGRMQFCNDCLDAYLKIYPQEWVGYPGDRCKHGVYTGGVGADYMCLRCEMGWEKEGEDS